MFCQQCGNKIKDGAMFCSACGRKVSSSANVQNESAQAVFSNSEPAPTVQTSPFMNSESAPVAQTSPFMNSEPAPVAQASPFMNSEPAPIAQASPFMNSEPAPTVQTSPFMNSEPAPVAQNLQGGKSNQTATGFTTNYTQNNMSNPFGNAPADNRQKPAANPVNTTNKNIAANNKINVQAKPKAANKAEKTSGQGGKIFLMALVQVIFVAIICFMGFTGKLNDSLGEINLVFTVGLLVVIMVIDALLYMLLFNNKKKAPIAMPPVERPKPEIKHSTPAYMSEIIKENTGIPDMDPVEDDDCPTEVSLPEENFDDGEATVVMDIPVVKYAKLEYVEDNVKKEILINKNEFIIGRLRGRVDFITTNKKIGRIHAAIITRDGAYFVKDFNSQNKTYLNRGAALVPEQEYPIKDNDTISFADSEFVFKLPE